MICSGAAEGPALRTGDNYALLEQPKRLGEGGDLVLGVTLYQKFFTLCNVRVCGFPRVVCVQLLSWMDEEQDTLCVL